MVKLTIEQIKEFIELEYTQGNKEPYKQLYSFCVRIWRKENKDRVAIYNNKYQKSIKNKSYSLNKVKNKSYSEVEHTPKEELNILA